MQDIKQERLDRGRVGAHRLEIKDLEALDADFAHLFSSWFNRGFLVLRRIDWTTPANILEKIIRYEAVHTIRDWDDLRRRLHRHPEIGFQEFRTAGIVAERLRAAGYEVRTGIAHASGDLVVIQDADLEYDPHDLPRLMQPLLDGRADAGQITPRRTSSTTPLQALNLLNSAFVLQQAGFLAARLELVPFGVDGLVATAAAESRSTTLRIRIFSGSSRRLGLAL